MTWLLCAVLGYLAGSIPFAIVVSRIMALPDPRSYGSKNIGATNVLRSGNKMAALLTMLGDIGKGWLAVMAARLLDLPVEMVALVGFAAFIGHLCPVWLRFNGGKGVATAAGVLLALNALLGLEVIAVWLAVAVVFRYSSLAALVAAVFAPILCWNILGDGPVLWAVIAMGVLLVARHHANIRKLLRGEETRIGQKKKENAENLAS